MTTQPLPRGQQLLLQRMLAFNGYSDLDARKAFKDLKKQQSATSSTTHNNNSNNGNNDDDIDGGGNNNNDNDSSFMGSAATLEEAFCSINQQLKPGFGLEIVSMVDPYSKDEAGRPTKFHAVVNMQADDIAKTSFGRSSFNDHERAYIRLVLQRLVEEESLSLKRSDLINLRSDLENGFKLQLNQAERMVQVLMEQGWLRVSKREIDDDDDDDDDEDGDGDGDGDGDHSDDDGNGQSPSSSRKRKKKGGKKKKTKKQIKSRSYHRYSVQNKLELAPRTYLELSHYLTDLGLDPQDMPQFLFHRNEKNEE